MRVCIGVAIVAALLNTSIALAAAPPLEAFARMPHIRSVTISPDGARIAYITAFEDASVVVTRERDVADSKPVPVLRSEPGSFDTSWCN